MKYLKKFQTETEYNSYKNGDEYKTPNLSAIVELKKVRFNKRATLPSFTIVNSVYTGTNSFSEITLNFTSGMTWNDFVTSPYNTVGIRNDYGNDYIEIFTQSYVLGTSAGAQNVGANDLIIANQTYYVTLWGCFVAGTQVLTSLDGATKNIEEVQVGDDVVSYDVDNNENYEAIVTHKYVNNASYNMAKVTCSDGTVLEMTDVHPLYTKEGWKSITGYHGYPELKVGDIVKTIDDWSEITSIDCYKLNEPVTTYTFNVKDKDEELDIDTNDGFYANGVLAHNKASK
jgi:hypothetical protein